MRRTRLVLALLAVAGAIVAVVVLSTGILGKAASADTSSPPCLPATPEHSAKLAGLPVEVSPAPGTDTANPQTQISFLGVAGAEISELSVEGQRSGRHGGRIDDYSQGDGASFVPDTPFDAGERVVVHAAIGPAHARGSLARKRTTFDFHVDTPYSTAAVPAFPNPTAAPADYQNFDTMPGVQAPIMSVTTQDRDRGAGYILTTNGPGPGRYGPLIYTPQGRLVWFEQLSGGQSAENLSVQSYKGRRDLTFWQGKVLSLGFGVGEDVVMSSQYQTVARIPGGNGLHADLHDFQIVPDGVASSVTRAHTTTATPQTTTAPRAAAEHEIAYITAYNPIRCDLSPVQGLRDGSLVDTAVQEIDMKTGLVRWEWHSLDHVGVAESETAPPTSSMPWDWFHLNSVDPQPDGNIFISARSTWAGYQLEHATGKILWRLGGLKSSFKMGPGTKTAWQHDGRILPSGEVSFFDNGSNPPIHKQSRAVRIALDFKTHEAHLRSVYTHSGPLLSVSQGNMQTLPSGRTVVGYGAVPEISEFANTGMLLLDAHLPYAFSSYRAVRSPWSGRPLSPPSALASLNNTGEETIVHASWNGATEVASWRVLAGEHPGALAPQTTIPASDFESSTSLPKKYAWVAVQALTSAGSLLGSSRATRVTSFAASLPNARRPG